MKISNLTINAYARASTLDLAAETGDLVVAWLNPVSGEYRDAAPVAGGQKLSLPAPWPEAVLHLKARSN